MLRGQWAHIRVPPRVEEPKAYTPRTCQKIMDDMVDYVSAMDKPFKDFDMKDVEVTREELQKMGIVFIDSLALGAEDDD
jgi:hypothetical protein